MPAISAGGREILERGIKAVGEGLVWLKRVYMAAAPGDAGSGSLGGLSATLLGFVDRYNQTARPFSWKFTATDLHHLMDRISRHEQQDNPQNEPLPQAA